MSLGYYSFSRKRLSKGTSKSKTGSSIASISSMDSDLMRITSCAAFRRLQDKTQLFPLVENDYPRTRLTHSIEVALTAKSITFLINKLIDNENTIKQTSIPHILKDAVEAACYLHDIGNPPFGHYGETVIRNYFTNNWDLLEVVKEDEKILLKDIIDKSQREYFDFSKFDGNAQALRVVTKLEKFSETSEGGLNLTSAVLGSLIKYPFDSTYTLEENKFGYFKSEEDVIEFLKCQKDYFENYIHPGALIMEAADDICMFVSDFEDSIKKGKIAAENIIKFPTRKSSATEFKKKFETFFTKNKKEGIDGNLTLISIKPLLYDVKNKLIVEVAEQFFSDFTDITTNTGKYKRDLKKRCKKLNHLSLIEQCEHYAIVEMSKKLLNSNVYCNDEIVIPELKGEEILLKILDLLTKSILLTPFDKIKKTSCKDSNSKVLKLFSKSFLTKYIDSVTQLKKDGTYDIKKDVYLKLRLVIDQVSGMTDNYALDFYRKLFV